ncbi:hypothetical protein PHMEG_00027198 [Phytophthora megakarya]|uniref:Uncharacterized protein n=1 Tax=Phytophthora megakarya TaxID=4795 RepID=A0A225V9G0_9STRA|nr:hypothetical protein PHMEG_00027198 [Phytophthora megakarya]
MVRLTKRSWLHLTPEVVEVDAASPFYARVARIGPDSVTFSFDGDEGIVSREVAEEHLVNAREVNLSGQISLLRQAVSLTVNDFIHYGQVVAVSGVKVTVQPGEHAFDIGVAAVTQVAPVVALMLELVEFNSSEWSTSDIEAVERTILDRVIGRDGIEGTRDVSMILRGLMSVESFPDQTRVCHWIDPRTGENAEFELQHVIDFAHFVDGGVPPKPRHVGESWVESTREVHELFDPFQDDDDLPGEAPEPRPNVSIPVPSSSRERKRTREEMDVLNFDPLHGHRKRPQVALDQDDMIMGKLCDDPELLDRFLKLRNEYKSRSCSVEQTRAIPTKVDDSASRKIAQGSSKYAFIPRQEQGAVHDRVTAEKHNGKSQMCIVKVWFGPNTQNSKLFQGYVHGRGLSIRHFARLSRDERMAWLELGGSNFDNLSATAEFGAASPAKSIEDVVDSARVFRTYARDFCCFERVELIDNIVKFIQETLMLVSWSTKELTSVVYLVNDVLEDVESNGEIITVTRRCTTENRLLRDIMFVKVHRQAQHIQQ